MKKILALLLLTALAFFTPAMAQPASGPVGPGPVPCAYIDCKVNTLAVGGATIGTDALGVTGTATISGNVTGGAFITTGIVTSSRSPGLSQSALLLSGAPQTGGTATTNFPLAYFNTSGAAAVTTFSTAGTYLGVNAASGFTGNFLDFHVNGGASVFSVNSTGGVITNSNLYIAGAGELGWNARAKFTSPTSTSIQLGAADGAAPQGYILRAQSGLGTNITGVSTTIIGSLGTGNLGSGDLVFQTGGAVSGSGTTLATPTTRLTIQGVTGAVIAAAGLYVSATPIGLTFSSNQLTSTGGTSGFAWNNNANSLQNMSLSDAGLFALPRITTDATHTDSSVCQDATTHAFYFGSGTLGICLGTSSARFKTGISPLAPGLAEILRLAPKSFYLDKAHGDPSKLMYGFIAEDMVKVLPKLVGLDKQGRPNSADYLGVVPVLVNAVHQQQKQIVLLKAANDNLTQRIARLERRH